jgi:hypothetical protein
MYPSTVHGSAMPESFTAKLDNIISALVDGSRNKDSTAAVNTAAAALTSAVTAASSDFVKVWKLH